MVKRSEVWGVGVIEKCSWRLREARTRVVVVLQQLLHVLVEARGPRLVCAVIPYVDYSWGLVDLAQLCSNFTSNTEAACCWTHGRGVLPLRCVVSCCGE